MKRLLAILLILTIALPVAAKKHQSEEIITPQTQLEKRKFQTRTYKANNQTAIMKSILNVLQDEGYIVYNVNSLLGFIYAVKDFDTTDHNIDISKEFGFSKSRLSYNGVKVATLETCANVTQYGDNIRVRMNFKRKLLNEYGNAQFIDDVSDAEFYDNFYNKLEKALSLQKELNSPKAVLTPETKEDTPSQQTPASETVVAPDLMKEINNHIEKIINSDTPEIPAISETNNDKKITEEPAKDEVKEQKEDKKVKKSGEKTEKAKEKPQKEEKIKEEKPEKEKKNR